MSKKVILVLTYNLEFVVKYCESIVDVVFLEPNIFRR